MRANGRDIVELFGYAPDDLSDKAKDTFRTGTCPFSQLPCSKRDHSSKLVYGVCSVSQGVSSAPDRDVIVCPARLYAQNHQVLRLVASAVWGDDGMTVLVGGDLSELKKKALRAGESVVAFGQKSGKEVSAGKMSMDWVLQRYTSQSAKLLPQDFVGIEVQSIDITNNYREPWLAYRRLKQGERVRSIPDSDHGLNWANVHKRLIPQIVRKGNLYSRTQHARGFFFLTPDQVFQKFEGVLGDLTPVDAASKDCLSILTFALGDPVSPGCSRDLKKVRQLHYKLSEVATAFITYVADDGPQELERAILEMLD